MNTYEKATISIGGELVEVTNLQMSITPPPYPFRRLALMWFSGGTYDFRRYTKPIRIKGSCTMRITREDLENEPRR